MFRAIVSSRSLQPKNISTSSLHHQNRNFITNSFSHSRKITNIHSTRLREVIPHRRVSVDNKLTPAELTLKFIIDQRNNYHSNRFISVNTPFNTNTNTNTATKHNNKNHKFVRYYSNEAVAVDYAPTKQEIPKHVNLEPNELQDLTPSRIITELDKFIVGQNEAKRAVSIAIRNRWRRHRVPKELQDEISPKNILMIGPTGVGKTEIARRIATIVNAPFIKVEATKYTEVGFKGKDVDSIIQDLIERAVDIMREQEIKRAKAHLKPMIEDRLLDALLGRDDGSREIWREKLRQGEFEDITVEYDLPVELKATPIGRFAEAEDYATLSQSSGLPALVKLTGSVGRRATTIRELRSIIESEELDKLVKRETIIKKALHAAEQDGIVFIDEIDKICQPERYSRQSDASDEGVQRDLLPIVEGTTINTKYGNVNTHKILFIASGAFLNAKPSDMLAELQGRLPIRVHLTPLTDKEYYKILTKTEANLIKQQIALLKTEDIHVDFTDESIREIALISYEMNRSLENIGARRLQTVVEAVVSDISFNCEQYRGRKVVLKPEYVREVTRTLTRKADNLKNEIL